MFLDGSIKTPHFRLEPINLHNSFYCFRERFMRKMVTEVTLAVTGRAPPTVLPRSRKQLDYKLGGSLNFSQDPSMETLNLF